MPLFARRRRPAWKGLPVVIIMGALATYGLYTGHAVAPTSRGIVPGPDAWKSTDPVLFWGIIRYQIFMMSLVAVLMFVRVIPVEDYLLRVGKALDEMYARDQRAFTPAPLWAWVFLACFIGLIAWLLWKYFPGFNV